MTPHDRPRFHLPSRRGARIATLIAVMIPIGFGAVLVFGAVVQFLWNAVMPDLTGAARLDLWRAVGLLVLARILVGSLHGGGDARRSRRREPPWRQYEDWWREVGEQSFRDYAGRRPPSDQPEGN